MNFWTRILIALGLVEKELHHITSPFSKMLDDSEKLALQKRVHAQEAEDAAAKALATKEDANAKSAAALNFAENLRSMMAKAA
jgi:hypothetical protein